MFGFDDPIYRVPLNGCELHTDLALRRMFVFYVVQHTSRYPYRGAGFWLWSFEDMLGRYGYTLTVRTRMDHIFARREMKVLPATENFGNVSGFDFDFDSLMHHLILDVKNISLDQWFVRINELMESYGYALSITRRPRGVGVDVQMALQSVRELCGFPDEEIFDTNLNS